MDKNDSLLLQAFPIISRLVSELYETKKRFIQRDEIADAMRRDRKGKMLLKRRVGAVQRSSAKVAGNTVDWFSAHFTQKSEMIAEWRHAFERTRMDGKYAYKPKRSKMEIAEEVSSDVDYPEGAVVSIVVNRYERNESAKNACKKHYGIQCIVCGFDFEEEFGTEGKGFIHVHHIKPISEVGKMYTVNPVKDLRPICPNCHAMAHRRIPPFSIDELKEMRQ